MPFEEARKPKKKYYITQLNCIYMQMFLFPGAIFLTLSILQLRI